jgi:condensin complex subunit 1
MAEQAINTIYVLGEQPDSLCSTILRDMTFRVFGKSLVQETPAEDGGSSQPSVEGAPPGDEARSASQSPSLPASDSNQDLGGTSTSQTPGFETKPADAFQLAQAVFAAGHCAVKHLIHLELVERDHKRRKVEGEKSGPRKSGGGEELDQVAGSVEDDIGDFIQATRENELLYGPESILAIYAPMTVQISANPKIYPVRSLHFEVGQFVDADDQSGV